MTREPPFTGPDEDGFFWMEWSDDEGTHSVLIGETLAEALARYEKITGEPGNFDLRRIN
jgi:predicted RNase H-like HicB family nuclease